MLSLILFSQEVFLTLYLSSSVITCTVFLSFVKKYGFVSSDLFASQNLR